MPTDAHRQRPVGVRFAESAVLYQEIEALSSLDSDVDSRSRLDSLEREPAAGAACLDGDGAARAAGTPPDGDGDSGSNVRGA